MGGEAKGEIMSAGLREIKVGSIWLVEDSARGYRQRTLKNAAEAHLTLACASDYSSGGERLTSQAAHGKYLALPLLMEPEDAAITLLNTLPKPLPSPYLINIAGNSAHTFSKRGISEVQACAWFFKMMDQARAGLPGARIGLLSGGQTGMDSAGAAYALARGLRARIRFPKGFLIRDDHGRDIEQSETECAERIQALTRATQIHLGELPSAPRAPGP